MTGARVTIHTVVLAWLGAEQGFYEKGEETDRGLDFHREPEVLHVRLEKF